MRDPHSTPTWDVCQDSESYSGGNVDAGKNLAHTECESGTLIAPGEASPMSASYALPPPAGARPRRQARLKRSPHALLDWDTMTTHTAPMTEEPEPSLKAAGDRLRAARKRAGLRQEDLAEILDVHQSTVSKWERGYLPSVSDLLAAARAVGASAWEILAPVIDETSGEDRPLTEVERRVIKALREAGEQPQAGDA